MKERCLKSKRIYVSGAATRRAQSLALTKSPFPSTQVHAYSQFSRHLVETLDRICDAVHRFETFTYRPVDHSFWMCELHYNHQCQSHEVQKKIFTLEATTASLHPPPANVVFAHSLNGVVGVHLSKVVRRVGGSSCWVVFEATSARFL